MPKPAPLLDCANPRRFNWRTRRINRRIGARLRQFPIFESAQSRATGCAPIPPHPPMNRRTRYAVRADALPDVGHAAHRCKQVRFMRSPPARTCATGARYAAAAIQPRGCALRRLAVHRYLRRHLARAAGRSTGPTASCIRNRTHEAAMPLGRQDTPCAAPCGIEPLISTGR